MDFKGKLKNNHLQVHEGPLLLRNGGHLFFTALPTILVKALAINGDFTGIVSKQSKHCHIVLGKTRRSTASQKINFSEHSVNFHELYLRDIFSLDHELCLCPVL